MRHGKINVNAILHFRYFWVYGSNFLIYIVTSERLRAAYLRFLRDVLLAVKKAAGGNDPSDSQVSSEPRWCSGMRAIDPSNSFQWPNAMLDN